MRVVSSFFNRAVRRRSGAHSELLQGRPAPCGLARGGLLAPLLVLLLAGCEQIAVLDGSKAIEAEGKAVGGACRHAGRALEDCYAMNEKASKAAVFTGWREMNDYMVQNKIETVPPVIVRPTGGKASAASSERKAETPGDPSRPAKGDKVSAGERPAQTASLPRDAGPGDHSAAGGSEGAEPRRPR